MPRKEQRSTPTSDVFQVWILFLTFSPIFGGDRSHHGCLMSSREHAQHPCMQGINFISNQLSAAKLGVSIRATLDKDFRKISLELEEINSDLDSAVLRSPVTSKFLRPYTLESWRELQLSALHSCTFSLGATKLLQHFNHAVAVMSVRAYSFGTILKLTFLVPIPNPVLYDTKLSTKS